MKRNPDSQIKVRGVLLDAWVSVDISRSAHQKRPTVSVSVDMEPHSINDLDRILDVKWNHQEHAFYPYSTSAKLRVFAKGLGITSKKPPRRWSVSIDVYKYYSMSKKYPDDQRFIDRDIKHEIIDAIISLFTHQPKIYSTLVSNRLDAMIEEKERKLVSYRKRAKNAEEGLLEFRRYAELISADEEN